MMETLVSIIFLFIVILIAVCLFYENRVLVPPVPTLPWVKRQMLEALAMHAPEQDMRIAELGSGWGGLAFALTRKFPSAEITGFELSPFPYWFSKIREVFHRRVSFERADFFERDLSAFNVVIFYLTPKLTERLSAKLRRDLKPGSLVISNAFSLPGWEPVQVRESRMFLRIPVYVYRVESENS